MYFTRTVIFLAPILIVLACNRYNNPELAKLPYKIAYNVLLDDMTGEYDIFTMNMDGSDKTNITNSPGVDWVYHSTKDKIYFISDRDSTEKLFFLYQMDINGENVKRITNFPVENSWIASRKDGKELVVSSAKDSSRYELYLIDNDGNELKRLTNNDVYDNDPSFSPDGKQIVFRSRRPKIDELYIMDLESDSIRQITSYPVLDDPSAGDFQYHAGPPFWEPNRNVITFMSYRNFNYDIYEIKPDGSDMKKLVDLPYDQGWHYWSPDGKYLAYDGTDKYGNYDIYLMELESRKIHQLTHLDQFEQAPVFIMRDLQKNKSTTYSEK
ncbi:MAG: hypothetical protein P8X42_05760 [Calditrichaceae bacterium]